MNKKKEVLEVHEKDLSFKISEAYDFKTYFQTRKGLWVWDGFKSEIVEKSNHIKKGVSYEISSFDLVKNAADNEIESELPEKHLFKESDVCALIAEMISKQPKGEDGVLLNTGYANLFYTPSCVVLVRWYSDDRGWGVSTWRRGGSRWGAGGRLFSPQLALIP